jgi:hypothetical protein
MNDCSIKSSSNNNGRGAVFVTRLSTGGVHVGRDLLCLANEHHDRDELVRVDEDIEPNDVGVLD